MRITVNGITLVTPDEKQFFEALGARITSLRKEQGLTQTQLAERCGTGERFIVDLENGKPSCQLEKSLIAARTVGINLGDLNSASPSPASAADDDLGYLPRFS